jgi:hypothetical protein
MRDSGIASVGDEREDVADELRRVRDEARAAATPASAAAEAFPAPELREPEVRRPEEPPAPEALPPTPDAAAVNAAWRAEPTPPRGLRGLLRRGLEWLLRGRFDALREWNAHQVRLDNEILGYLDARFAATHRHYDRVLGREGRRLDEIDERHVLLERELVAHVRDLVRRIDIVLAESGRGRAALEFTLEDVRARLARLEEALRRRS